MGIWNRSRMVLLALLVLAAVSVLYVLQSEREPPTRTAPVVQCNTESSNAINSNFTLTKTLLNAETYFAESLKRSNYINGTNIPRMIHHIWFTYPRSEFSQDVNASINSWNHKNPDFLQLVWENDDAQSFVDKYYPEFGQLFADLPLLVLRADLFRYMVLSVFGGVYSDIDTICLRPIDSWTDKKINISFILGIEADPGNRPDWNDWYARQLQWCQWTIAAAPKHPILVGTIYQSISRIKGVKKVDKNAHVMEFTGPGVWTDTVNHYLRSIGTSWKEFQSLPEARLVGDTYVLTITGFSPGVGHMGSKSIQSPEACVEHRFKGMWKESAIDAS